MTTRAATEVIAGHGLPRLHRMRSADFVAEHAGRGLDDVPIPLSRHVQRPPSATEAAWGRLAIGYPIGTAPEGAVPLRVR